MHKNKNKKSGLHSCEKRRFAQSITRTKETVEEGGDEKELHEMMHGKQAEEWGR